MANGTVRVIDKEIIESAQQADFFVCVKDGAVKLAKPGSIGDISIIDEDDNDEEYFCQLRIRNGHLVVVTTLEE